MIKTTRAQLARCRMVGDWLNQSPTARNRSIKRFQMIQASLDLTALSGQVSRSVRS